MKSKDIVDPWNHNRQSWPQLQQPILQNVSYEYWMAYHQKQQTWEGITHHSWTIPQLPAFHGQKDDMLEDFLKNVENQRQNNNTNIQLNKYHNKPANKLPFIDTPNSYLETVNYLHSYSGTDNGKTDNTWWKWDMQKIQAVTQMQSKTTWCWYYQNMICHGHVQTQ